MDLVLAILISIAFAILCVAMARKRRRNEMLWGILGFLLGPIPAILLAILGVKERTV